MIFIRRKRIPKWSKISVEMYQYINEINESDMSDIDKILYTIVALTSSTENEIDNENPSTIIRLQKQLKKRFLELNETRKECRKLKGFKFNYDIEHVTFGQYIEIQHFLRKGHIENIHLIASSICKKGKMNHKQRGEAILKLPMLPILWNVAKFLEVFKEFNDSYKGLFGIEDMEEDDLKPITNPFNEQYGWIYSAKKVAEMEGITLEKAFDLPVIQAFNDLAYLKAYQAYENEITKRQMHEVN